MKFQIRPIITARTKRFPEDKEWSDVDAETKDLSHHHQVVPGAHRESYHE